MRLEEHWTLALDNTDDILTRLEEDYRDFSPQVRRAARYVLDNPTEVGVRSIRQLATAAAVKPNAMVRMAKVLGFSSYEDFRRPFREVLIKGGIETFPDRVRWLQTLAHGHRHGQLYSQMAAANLTNVEQLFSGTSPDEMKEIADKIVASRATYVLGLGSCYPLAQAFWYVARMALAHLVLSPRHASLPVDDLAEIGPGDVLLAMTFNPYRVETVDAVEFAAAQGALVVSITDSRTSPITHAADHVLVVPVSSPQFFPSSMAVVALLELLIAFMVADADAAVIKRIERFHRLRLRSRVYWTDEQGRAGI